jgi:uncharacterized protein (TIGR02145 family)
MQNTIIKDYQIKSELGRGGMASVYLAHDIKFQTNVAIKVLNKEYVHNDNIRKRFIAEARNMFKMSHPNIIKVNDLIDDGDTVAFVMEHIEGETLKEHLDRKGKLNDDEIKTIFSQMLEAVGYVHDKKLVHRDIKPSNFMINSEGQIKLLDFGIAKNTDANSADYTQTGTTQNMGTPMYMSPEQIKSTKDVTLQSDIYSLGVVLWQMVMGKKPYDTNTSSTYELQTKIVTENLSLTNSKFDSIIEVATAKELNIRFNTCNELKSKLESLDKEGLDNTKSYSSEVSEKTILNDSNEKTKPQVEVNIPKSPPKKKINPLVFVVITIIIVGVILFIKNSKKSVSGEIEEVAVLANITIGTQVWGSTNLDVTTYRDGTPIPEVTDPTAWASLTTGAWCYYNNDAANGKRWGKLYNWYAVNDPRGLAPEGWHIPSDAEWTTLTTFLGGEDVAGGKMKSELALWQLPNKAANNESGFTGLPGGFRYGKTDIGDGAFEGVQNLGFWWSSTDYSPADAWYRYMFYDSGGAARNHGFKNNGFSVRCIRD